jgi:hypothetical protein
MGAPASCRVVPVEITGRGCPTRSGLNGRRNARVCGIECAAAETTVLRSLADTPKSAGKMPALPAIASHRQKIASERKQTHSAPVIVTVMKIAMKVLISAVITLTCLPGLKANEASAPTPPPGTRYGLFDWLDHRSDYGQGVFPEPFLVDDSDLEPGEARLDGLHTAAGSRHRDEVTAEVEKGFGLLTLELEVPYESDTSSDVAGVGTIDLGARCPFYQFVSADGLVDSTFGAATEIGIPTGSAVGKNAELVPKIFNDLKAGDFTLQSVLGYSTLFGPGADGGLQTFEYGFVFGYTIPRRAVPLPDVQELIPVFELIGETELNKDNPGRNSLLGNLGLRLNLKAIGPVQPRPGFGFVFPINEAARDDVHWGVVASLVFQF